MTTLDKTVINRPVINGACLARTVWGRSSFYPQEGKHQPRLDHVCWLPAWWSWLWPRPRLVLHGVTTPHPLCEGPFSGFQVWLSVRGTARLWTMDGVPSGAASLHFRGDFTLGLGVAAAVIVSEQNLLKFEDKNIKNGASLVVQWLGVFLPTQGTRVRALAREDPTCRGAAEPVHHNY